jgi:hypothetical protein
VISWTFHETLENITFAYGIGLPSKETSRHPVKIKTEDFTSCSEQLDLNVIVLLDILIKHYKQQRSTLPIQFLLWKKKQDRNVCAM